jgi:hypothetical protein
MFDAAALVLEEIAPEDKTRNEVLRLVASKQTFRVPREVEVT